MKSKVLVIAAAMIVILSYVSCTWFTSSSKKPSLVGDWQLVSMADSSKDSSRNAIGLLLLSITMKDSLRISFNNDSSFSSFTAKEKLDSGKYSFHPGESGLKLFAKDTSYFAVETKSNDTLQLNAVKDSVSYSFIRIKK